MLAGGGHTEAKTFFEFGLNGIQEVADLIDGLFYCRSVKMSHNLQALGLLLCTWIKVFQLTAFKV